MNLMMIQNNEDVLSEKYFSFPKTQVKEEWCQLNMS